MPNSSATPSPTRRRLAVLPGIDAPVFRARPNEGPAAPHLFGGEPRQGLSSRNGIKPWRQTQPDFDPEIIGAIMSSYFGGRARNSSPSGNRPNALLDFASMYPTVCTLMGLLHFVIASGMAHEDATADAQAFLDRTTVADLARRETWSQLHVLVQVLPDTDIFPVRSRYGSEPIATIGLNYLSADQALWFTLADCMASKLLTGKSPKVTKAIRFRPLEPQAALRPIAISGNERYRVHPTHDDFYKRVIDLRRSLKPARRRES